MNDQPSAAGIETGRVTPFRTIPGGIFFVGKRNPQTGLWEDDGQVRNHPAALRVLRQAEVRECNDFARQYLSGQGDGVYSAVDHATESALLQMHKALIPVDAEVGRMPAPLYPVPITIASKGKIDRTAMDLLELRNLADGQLEAIMEQYQILQRTQCPPYVSHEQFGAVVAELKKSSFWQAQHSQDGFSAVIAVLHGLAGRALPA
jgi:hypothetical protein